MSAFDDPTFYEEVPVCTCVNRALRPEEMVTYMIPRRLGHDIIEVETMVFAKDCPIHGYTVDSKEEP